MGARTSKIYLKNVEIWVDASDEERRAYNREGEAERKRNQRRKTCACPKEKRWMCDADCQRCQFNREGLFLSMDTFLSGDDGAASLESVIEGESPDAERLLIEKESLEGVMHRLSELDPAWEEIARLRLEGMNITDISSRLGRNRRTLNDQMKRYERIADSIFYGEF